MTSGKSLLVKIPVARRESIARESLGSVDSWLHKLKDSRELEESWEKRGSISSLPSKEHCSELPFPTPGDLCNPVINPMSPVSPALAGGFFTTEPMIYGQIIIKYFAEFPSLPHILFLLCYFLV